MLLQWVIGAVLQLLNNLMGLLPNADTSFFGNASSIATGLTGYVNEAGIILPVQLIVTVIYTILVVVIPAIFVYELAQWGYRELPEILGFGS